MKEETFEKQPRKLVYVRRQEHESQRGFEYVCPECGTNLPQSHQGKIRYCKVCGNYLSWANVELERRKKFEEDFDQKMSLWEFMKDPENGFSEDYNLSMTTSHSEKEILEGCISLMHQLVNEFRGYLEFLGIDVDDIDKDEQFNTQFSYFEIVNRLFLWHTSHSGGTSTRMKMANLGIGDEWGESFSIADEEEEGEEEKEGDEDV